MSRLAFLGPVLVALAAVTHAQTVSILGRVVPTAMTAALPSVIQLSDLNYLGSCTIPGLMTAGENPYYGQGLALRYEPTDGVNQVHLLSGAFAASNPPVNFGIYEFRICTPGSGSPNPINGANYPAVAIMKEYIDVYSGKRTRICSDMGCNTPPTPTPFNQSIFGGQGIYIDPSNYSRLYWDFADTYTNSVGQWSIGYSDLNYAAGTGTGHGPWSITGQNQKALWTGFVGIRSGFASAYLTAGQTLGVGLGGPGSLIATGDTSMGPSITAIVPPTGATTEQTALSGTSLVGYWPFVTAPDGTHGRMTRTTFTPPPGNGGAYQFDSWPGTKFSAVDGVRAGAWIVGTSHNGLCFLDSYGTGEVGYLSSNLSAEGVDHVMNCYAESGLAAVAQGSVARYNLQPASTFQFHLPVIDYTHTPWAFAPSVTVSSITSTAGCSVCGIHCASTDATVNATAHGFVGGDKIRISSPVQTEYDGLWLIDSVTTNSFTISNSSISGAVTWDGVTGTGTMFARYVSGHTISGQAIMAVDPMGMVIDNSTKTLYIMVAPIDNGSGGCCNTYVFVCVFQVS